MKLFLSILSTFLLCWVVLAMAQKSRGSSPENNGVASQPEILFREIGTAAGISGITVCGACQKTSIAEVNCGGLCWLDYNNDGLLDLFITNGATLEELQAIRVGQLGKHRNSLYRNNGDGTFTDVTENAGVPGYTWGSGCAAADYDNDGRVDLFVSNLGENLLYKNQGDGTFIEVAKKVGVSGGFNWHTGAAFGDYDGDGYLDLYVSSYLDLARVLDDQKKCDWRGLKIYCGPRGMKGAPDTLYHNNGDGTFTDVTRQAGIEDRDSLYGFTASFEDFDTDGRPDIFVANDLGRNLLYHNLGKGKFEEVGELWGVAYPIEGNAQANMGVAIGDYDRNGTMDVFVTTFSDDHYTLYRNTGKQMFMDTSTETRVGPITIPFMGWGTFFVDLDNDGRLDLFAVNGHIYPEVDKLSGFKEGFGQRPLLFRQSAQGTFTEIGLHAGLAKLKLYSSRGAAYADFDNDGDLDIVYSNLGAAPTFLENVTPTFHHWVTIQTVGTRSNRDGIGARLKLRAGDLIQYATVRSGESYLSGNDPRIHFGLGDKKIIDEVEIRWPSGQVDKLTHLDANQIVKVREGEGLVISKHDKE